MKMIREILRRGDYNNDFNSSFNSPDHSRVEVAGQGAMRCSSYLGARTAFELLPAAAVAAGTDKLLIATGTGTEVIARSTAAKGGGVNMKTQASTPTTGDNAILAGVATTKMEAALNALTGLRFSAKVSLASIADEVFSIGLSENVTDADPAGTAGEGALFLFDPDETVTTGLNTAQHANWILAHKVNGDDTFTATTIPVVADDAYDLVIEVGSDLKAKFYINGTLVGTGPVLTAGDTVKAFAAIETKASAQKDFDLRFVELGAQNSL